MKLENSNRSNETKHISVNRNGYGGFDIVVNGHLYWICETELDVMGQFDSCHENDFLNGDVRISINGMESPKRDYTIFVSGQEMETLEHTDIYNAQAYGWLKYGRFAVTFEIL